MSYDFEIESGTTVKFPVGGKYCDRDIVVTATGGTENLDDVLAEQESLIADLQAALMNKASGGENYLPDIVDKTITEITDYRLTRFPISLCADCVVLEAVNAPNVVSVGESAFARCKKLARFMCEKVESFEKLSLSNTRIVNADFRECTFIGLQAFYFVSSLRRAHFPKVASIQAQAFHTCSTLEALIIRKTDAVCVLSNVNAFTGSPIATGKGYVYVPAVLVEEYKAATNWSTYASQFRAIEDYPEICGEVMA